MKKITIKKIVLVTVLAVSIIIPLTITPNIVLAAGQYCYPSGCYTDEVCAMDYSKGYGVCVNVFGN